MGQKLRSDKQLRESFGLFFDAVARARLVEREDIARAVNSGNFRISISGSFDTALCRKEELVLVERCVSLLGTSVAHESDIRKVAWEAAESAPNTSESARLEAYSRFLEALDEWSSRSRRYILPCTVVDFAEGSDELVVGPVRVRRGDKIVSELSRIASTQQIEMIFEVGTPALRVVDCPPRLVVAPICWDVLISASPDVRYESASWMIEAALSLIRLSGAVKGSLQAPNLGDPEPTVSGELWLKSNAITLDETVSFSTGSEKFLGRYTFDQRKCEPADLERLQAWGEAILLSSPGTVAERLFQGLGWQSRGRSARDRSEKLLHFFTAIEALLSQSDQTSPIVQTVSRHAAVLWTDDCVDRTRISAKLRDLYKIRSALVHTGKRAASSFNVVEVQQIVEELFWSVLDADVIQERHQTFCDELSVASYGMPWPRRRTAS